MGACNPIPIPVFRYNPADQRHYVITGGAIVYLVRTRDFQTWESSPNAPFIMRTEADAKVRRKGEHFPRLFWVLGVELSLVPCPTHPRIAQLQPAPHTLHGMGMFVVVST